MIAAARTRRFNLLRIFFFNSCVDREVGAWYSVRAMIGGLLRESRCPSREPQIELWSSGLVAMLLAPEPP